MRLIFLCFLIVFPVVSYSQTKTVSFKSTLDKHLNAITGKNLADIEATVADSITLIFPNGKVLKSKQKFVEFHKSWFEDLPQWKMNLQIVSTQESSALAHALVKYHYTESDKDGKIVSESNTFLLLIFQKQSGGWKLLHDQNTKII